MRQCVPISSVAISPTGHKGDGNIIQGLPVAIGTGRHSTYGSTSSGSGGYASGGSSPGSSSDSGHEDRLQHVSRLSRSLGYGLSARQG